MVKSEKTLKKPNNKKFKKGPRRRVNTKNHGWVYLGHIPHGFYEEQIKEYFEQFGRIVNVRVCRSAKTGGSKGYGFIEFADHEVAKIAATTMDNYLMFKKRLVAKYVPADKMKKLRISNSAPWSEDNYPLKKKREKLNAKKNARIDNSTYLKQCKAFMSHVKKIQQKLKDLGIDYSFIPVDVPLELEGKCNLTAC
ncbi:hypothetical protein FQA39_LY17789 [Lamprigera yunnana]|nr:hypothetical protein FQA39_LY17789 [Lamprigera yunnana]